MIPIPYVKSITSLGYYDIKIFKISRKLHPYNAKKITPIKFQLNIKNVNQIYISWMSRIFHP